MQKLLTIIDCLHAAQFLAAKVAGMPLMLAGDFAGAGIALAGVCICWFWPRKVRTD